MKIAAITDIGSCRQENQDNYCAQQLAGGTAWGIVCDGMGGVNGGRIAARIATDTMQQYFARHMKALQPGMEKTFIMRGFDITNRAVYEKSTSDPEMQGMGTTGVCAYASRGMAHVVHAGETVEGDSTVILYVSRSEVSKESSVPSLTGKTIEEARNEVKGLNLSIRTIEQASEQPAGTVLSQSPDAGSTVRKSSVITLVVSTGVPEVVATPEPVEPTVNEDGTVTVQESWWPSADGSHQIHQLTDGTMWNENGQRCDAQGNPIA